MGEQKILSKEMVGMNKVLTMGTFDLLHVGHFELFKYCFEFSLIGTESTSLCF